MVEEMALVDDVVSAPTWGRFPALRVAVGRWAELAQSEAGDLVVSAFTIGMEWASIRVTRIEGHGEPVDWTEWLAPFSFCGASQSALDHFVTRELHRAATILQRRTEPYKGTKDLATVPEPNPIPDRGNPVAKKKAPAVPTPEPAPAKVKGKPGRKPKVPPATTKEDGRGVPAPSRSGSKRPAGQPASAPVATPVKMAKAKPKRATPSKAAASKPAPKRGAKAKAKARASRAA